MRPLAGATLLLCFGVTGAVVADDDGDLQIEPLQSALEEVVVTAQRREERLQDVPISVSAFSAIALERLQIEDIRTLQYAAPNLTVTPWPGSPSRATIAMRGQVEPDRFPTVDPAVGVYLDGVYIARMGGANLDLFDMERVEVLRGPQGTLFGRNTIGGAINLVSRRPGPEFEGAVTGAAGNYDRRDLEAVINVPIADDDVAVRLAALHTEHSGYGRNALLEQDLNEGDTQFARAQLRVMPAERWDLNLSFDYTRSTADRDLVTLLAVYPPLTHFPTAAGNPDDRLQNYVDPTARSVHANRIGPAESTVWGASSTLKADFARFTVMALSAYRSLQTTDRAADVDGTPYDLFTIFDRDESQHQWSHELQAYGDDLGERLSWIGGLHYFEEQGTFSERFQGIQSTTFISSENVSAGAVTNEAIAAYAQLTYSIAPNLRVTAGARYNEDRRRLTSRNARRIDGVEFCALPPGVRDDPGICMASLPEREFSYLPWTLAMDFRPSPGALLYTKVSRGHRAGGYNFRGVTGTDADTFEPEQVTVYEIGTRLELIDHRLRLDLTWYRSLFDDIQVRTQVSLPGALLSAALTQNAGKARMEGGELEVLALLGSLRLAGTLGVTDGRYTKLDPRVLAVTLDSSLLGTPQTTASICADLPFAARFGGVNLHVDYSWRDDEPFSYDPQSLARQQAYGLLNAMVTAQVDRANLELSLWARNLTDTSYVLRSIDFGSLVNAMPGDPRTYGASLTYRFGNRRPAARHAARDVEDES